MSPPTHEMSLVSEGIDNLLRIPAQRLQFGIISGATQIGCLLAVKLNRQRTAEGRAFCTYPVWLRRERLRGIQICIELFNQRSGNAVFLF